MSSMPGVPNIKVARDIATLKNGLVDASKTINRTIQKAPENTVKLGLETTKKVYENEFKKKAKKPE